MRAGEQLDRERRLAVREYLPRLQPRGVSHGHVILLPGARRDRIHRRGMREHLVLGDERRGHVLGNHEPAVQPTVGREERRQPVGQIRVHEAFDTALGDRCEFGDRHRHHVERERERLPVEVAVGDERLLLDEHERIVRRRVQLHRDRVVDVVEEIARRPVHLRRAAKRVRVLHLVAPAVRLDDGRALEQLQHVRRRRGLAAQRAERVDLRDERGTRSLQRFERLRARNVGCMRETARAHEPERAIRRHELRAVDEREAFLRRELHGLEPGARQRFETGHALALEERLALADERKREMRERSEVTGCADASPRRHHGDDPTVEAREHQLDRLDARTRVPLCERVGAQQHRSAHDLVRIRLADAARVRPEQSAAGAPRSAPPESTATRSGRTRC